LGTQQPISAMAGLRCLTPDLALSFGGQQQPRQVMQLPQEPAVATSSEVGSPMGMSVHTNTLYDLWDSSSFKRLAGQGSFRQADSFCCRQPTASSATGGTSSTGSASANSSAQAVQARSNIDSAAAAAGSTTFGAAANSCGTSLGPSNAADGSGCAALVSIGGGCTTGERMSSAGQGCSQRPGSPRACPALPVLPAVQHHAASRLQPLDSRNDCKPLQQQQQWPGLSNLICAA
jgi:hypothetical protein